MLRRYMRERASAPRVQDMPQAKSEQGARYGAMRHGKSVMQPAREAPARRYAFVCAFRANMRHTRDALTAMRTRAAQRAAARYVRSCVDMAHECASGAFDSQQYDATVTATRATRDACDTSCRTRVQKMPCSKDARMREESDVAYAPLPDFRRRSRPIRQQHIVDAADCRCLPGYADAAMLICALRRDDYFFSAPLLATRLR